MKRRHPVHEDITPEMWAKVDEILDELGGRRGALIPVLQKVQTTVGYLPMEVQQYVADRLGVSPAEVFGVVTFYAFFSIEPLGRHHCKVCLGTACYVKGGDKIMKKITQDLGLPASGGTEKDRRFTVEGVRCVGACGLAPVVIINENVHRQVDVMSLPGILGQYE